MTEQLVGENRYPEGSHICDFITLNIIDKTWKEESSEEGSVLNLMSKRVFEYKYKPYEEEEQNQSTQVVQVV